VTVIWEDMWRLKWKPCWLPSIKNISAKFQCCEVSNEIKALILGKVCVLMALQINVCNIIIVLD
jgi:hypothetical protein